MLKNKILYGLLILFVGFAMSINTATAQVTGEEGYQSQNSFKGKVVDASTGQALADVTVKIKDQNLEATTDEEGKFTFDNLNLDLQGQEAEEGMGNPGITIEIDHEGYQTFSETISPEDIRSQSQGTQDMGDPQDPAVQSDENLMTFELEPKVSS